MHLHIQPNSTGSSCCMSHILTMIYDIGDGEEYFEWLVKKQQQQGMLMTRKRKSKAHFYNEVKNKIHEWDFFCHFVTCPYVSVLSDYSNALTDFRDLPIGQKKPLDT